MKSQKSKAPKKIKLTKETLRDLHVKAGVRAGMKCCMSGGFGGNLTSGCSFRG
jgi:hypothetical protein